MAEYEDKLARQAASSTGNDESNNEPQSNWDECTTTFDSMDLKEDLLRGIYAYGFEKPSAIQQRAIKPTLMGKDVIAQAQSGEEMVGWFGLLLNNNNNK